MRALTQLLGLASGLALNLLPLVAGCGSDRTRPSGWVELEVPSEDQWLMSVTATPDGESWFIVGGTREQGALFQGDGESFAALAPGDVPLLTWAHAFGPDDVFVVGDQGTALHFDGSEFVKHDVPTDQDLWGVWGASPDDVWAVGGDGRAEGHATLLHFDGTSWSAVDQPALERPKVWAWYKVWGAAADDVWVVGQSGGLLHFDGEAWNERLGGISDDLISVWGSDADHVIMVGGRDNARVVRWDGESLTPHSLAPMPGLNGVWMSSDHTAYVAGIEGTLADVDFSIEPRDVLRSTRLAFHAVHGAGSRLIAVGGNLGSTVPPHRGIAMTRKLTSP